MNLSFTSRPRATLAGLAAGLMSALAGAAIAQVPAPAGATATPAVPAIVEFRSALDGYQPHVDEEAVPWKEANDSVGRIGGWRAYAKEAQQTSQPPAATGAAGQPDPHAGHANPPQDKP